MKKTMLPLVLAGLVLVACSQASASAPSVEGQWELVSYGSPSSRMPAAPGVITSIEFKDGQMSGNVGCNGFGGEYSVEGDAITFGPVMSTMMFCEDVAGQESGTLAVFRERTIFVLDGDELTITSADGNASVVLERK